MSLSIPCLTFAQAKLIKDLNRLESAMDIEYDELTQGNNTMFFTSLGKELWNTDGTNSGTKSLKRFDSLAQLTWTGTTLFFAGKDDHGWELWRSRGLGTTKRVKDIYPGVMPSRPKELTNVNGLLYFVAEDAQHGRELWKSDGTAAGTVMVKDIIAGQAGSSPSHLANVNGVLYFSAEDGVHGRELWVSDGTLTGTKMVRDINSGIAGSFPESFTYLKGRTFFTAFTNSAGRELWATNGSASETVLFKDIKSGPASSDIANIVAMGDALYFTADDGNGSYSLWKSTGTIAGTTSVIDVSSNAGDFFFLKAVNGNLYFLASTGEEDYLWRSDGTKAGTHQVMIMSRATHPVFVLFKNSIYFFEYYWDDELYTAFIKLNKMNPEGTDVDMIRKLNYGWPGFEGRKLFNSPLININNELIFYGALKDGQGFKILKTDGTPEGTSFVRDTYIPTFSAEPDLFVRAGGLLYMRSGRSSGSEDVFRTDGTPAGTFRLKTFEYVKDIEAVNGNAFFAGTTYSGNWQLWKTDGTRTGTTLVKQLSGGGSLAQANNILYFFGRNGELWKSDGTPAGTVRIKQFAQFGGLYASGKLCYISTANSDGSPELWKTDGTAGGTVLVKRVKLSVTPHYTDPITAYGKFYFVGNDGTHGYELWRSDGTPGGTYMVKDLRTDDLNAHDFHSLTEFQDEVYFSAIESGNQYALYRSNGTAAGTKKIINIGQIIRFIPYKHQLLLFPFSLSGPPTIWSTNGTSEGTAPLKTLEGASGIEEVHEVNVDDVVYFTTGSTCCGERDFQGELWRTDGTECGTFEIQTGLSGVSPVGILGNNLILGGYARYEYGKELYSYDLTNAPETPCEVPYAYSTPNDGTVRLTARNTTGVEIVGDIIREGPNSGEIITEFKVPAGDTYVYIDDDALPGTTYLYVFEYNSSILPDWVINLDYITPVATMPALGSFNLVAPAPYNDVYDVLRDGKVINIEKTNIQAEANEDYTGSVVFYLNGERRDDNTYPFSLFGDVGGDYNDGELEDGAYTLTAIAYPEENGQGTPGDTATVSFSVENIYSTQVTVYPNPVQANSVVYIRGAANAPVVIDLVDESRPAGRDILYNGVMNDTGRLQHPVSSRNLTQGVYVLSVHIDGRVIQQRIVIE